MSVATNTPPQPLSFGQKLGISVAMTKASMLHPFVLLSFHGSTLTMNSDLRPHSLDHVPV